MLSPEHRERMIDIKRQRIKWLKSFNRDMEAEKSFEDLRQYAEKTKLQIKRK